MRSATIRSCVIAIDQLQLREDHWVIADLVGKGGRLRTVPIPEWCMNLINAWLCDSGVTGGEDMQAHLETRNSAGGWSDHRRCLVRGKTTCEANRD
jgi:hypothetical protein